MLPHLQSQEGERDPALCKDTCVALLLGFFLAHISRQFFAGNLGEDSAVQGSCSQSPHPFGLRSVLGCQVELAGRELHGLWFPSQGWCSPCGPGLLSACTSVLCPSSYPSLKGTPGPLQLTHFITKRLHQTTTELSSSLFYKLLGRALCIAPPHPLQEIYLERTPKARPSEHTNFAACSVSAVLLLTGTRSAALPQGSMKCRKSKRSVPSSACSVGVGHAPKHAHKSLHLF